MIDSGAPIGPLDAALLRPRASGAPASAGAAQGADFGATLSRELEGPPPELRSQVERASRRWEELRASDRELRFERDPESGRLVVEIRDLEGNLIRTAPASAALDIAAGAPA